MLISLAITFLLLPWPRQSLAALPADPDLDIAFPLMPDAHRAARAANQHHIRNLNGRFLLGDSTLDIALRIGVNMFFHHAYVFHQQPLLVLVDAQHPAPLALIATRDYFHRIVSLNIQAHSFFSTSGPFSKAP